jgi:transcription initiation factor TFIIIB Brf1 subunit/transcription initiation factor TFIIB
MQCPRCHSERIQRDYDDAIILLRAVGMHKLLCNNCGLVFKGFDPQGKFQRDPEAAKRKESAVRPAAKQVPNRRRGPRFNTHLPATISLIEGDAQVGKASYSEPSRGHCETISSYGMLLSLVGTRFGDGELSRPGRRLLVRVNLPNGAVEAVVAIVTHERRTEGQKPWSLGVKIQQMSDADRELLAEYVERRFKAAEKRG